MPHTDRPTVRCKGRHGRATRPGLPWAPLSLSLPPPLDLGSRATQRWPSEPSRPRVTRSTCPRADPHNLVGDAAFRVVRPNTVVQRLPSILPDRRDSLALWPSVSGRARLADRRTTCGYRPQPVPAWPTASPGRERSHGRSPAGYRWPCPPGRPTTCSPDPTQTSCPYRLSVEGGQFSSDDQDFSRTTPARAMWAGGMVPPLSRIVLVGYPRGCVAPR